MKHPWQHWEIWALGIALLHSAGSRRILHRQRTEPIATQQCLDVVAKVTVRKRFTEDFIAGVCAEVTSSSPKCEFFSEALSLASSHPNFSADHFCLDIDQAEICSDHMDKLLVSQPVADLAYGECLRGKQGEDHAYCKRFREMLAFAVRNADLDTLRACYVIEAQNTSDPTGSEIPKMRIITSGGEELSSMGFSNTTGTSAAAPATVNSGIVLQPKPFEDFGAGVSHPISQRTGSIIVAPKPIDAPQGQLLLAAAKVEGQVHPTADLHSHTAAPVPVPLAGPNKTKAPAAKRAATVPSAARPASLAGTAAALHVVSSAHPTSTHANRTAQQPTTQLHARATKVATAASTAPTATKAPLAALVRKPSLPVSRGTPGPAAVVAVVSNHSRNSSEEPANTTVLLSQGIRPNASESPTALNAANTSQLVNVSQAGENTTDSHVVHASHNQAKGNATLDEDNSVAGNVKGNHSALSVRARVQIVTRAAPLTPVSGHLHLKPKSWANASHRTGGAVQETSGKKQRERRGKGDRKEATGEYTGFLSKFVQ